jgi:ABC-2 type transport system permease protein
VTSSEHNIEMIKLLVVKDWQVYQKQLAGYLAGLILALSLIGTAKPWSFNAGGLLLLVLLISTGFFAIGHIVLNERKEQTLPFVMSLPVTPVTFYIAKLLAGLIIYLVPFALVVSATAFLIHYTPLPDGMLVYAMLVFCFMLMTHCVALCVAVAVESEGWNIFIQMALMTMLGPFMVWAARLQSIAANIRTDRIVWSPDVVSVLAAELLVLVLALGSTGWSHARKSSFL